MIRSVSANQPTFRTVTFHEGFNLVLAERTEQSTERDTRNGLGKSLLVEIIHFCFGSRATAGSGLVREELAGWEFRVEVEINHSTYVFSRAVDEPRWVYVSGETDAWPVPLDVIEGRLRTSWTEHNRALGRLLFGLDAEIEELKFGPTSRSLFSYLARRRHDGFLTPFEHHRNQKVWDKQVNVAYHLAINWRAAHAFQQLNVKRHRKAHHFRAPKSAPPVRLRG